LVQLTDISVILDGMYAEISVLSLDDVKLLQILNCFFSSQTFLKNV